MIVDGVVDILIDASAISRIEPNDRAISRIESNSSAISCIKSNASAISHIEANTTSISVIVVVIWIHLLFVTFSLRKDERVAKLSGVTSRVETQSVRVGESVVRWRKAAGEMGK